MYFPTSYGFTIVGNFLTIFIIHLKNPLVLYYVSHRLSGLSSLSETQIAKNLLIVGRIGK